MPYYVKVGEVRNGSQHYVIGDCVPDSVADEAMVEAGAIEWQEEGAETVAPESQPSASDLESLGALIDTLRDNGVELTTVEVSGAPDIPSVPAEDSGPSAPTEAETEPEGAAEAAPVAPEPDLDAMDMKELRAVAKAAGINSFGKSHGDLLELLKAAK
jgi:hypothetical protein